MTLPSFLMIKAIIAICLITLNKSVKRFSDIWFVMIYLGIILGYVWSVYRLKPYNYARMNLWQLCLAIAVLWVGILSSAAKFVNSELFTNVLFLVLLIFGWLCIYAACYLILKKFRREFPVLVVSPKPEKIENLMRF